MQLTQAVLDHAKQLLEEASDNEARVRLSWVVKAFEWTLEPPGRASPAILAAETSPLDHDGDGRPGGSSAPKPRRKKG